MRDEGAVRADTGMTNACDAWRRRVFGVALALALCGSGPLAWAEEKYPSRPVRIVVPVSAGSSADARVRLLAEKLSARLQQRFVVENKPGAGATLGTALVAAAKPDGYTLLVNFTPSYTVGPIVYKNAGYDAVKSFTPICTLLRAAPIFAVHPGVPAQSFKEFLALVQASPASMTVAHTGAASGTHLPAEILRRATKSEFNYVTYKSESLAFPDLVGGQVSSMFVYTGAGVPLIKAGKLRALAVAGTTRNPALPDVPTFKEVGLPAVEFHVYGLLLAPAGTPANVIDTLYGALREIVKEPDVIQSYETTGAELLFGSADEARALIQRELGTSAAIVKDLGITME